ncbi:alpha/beta hydrolase [Gemmatimonas sp.]|uniref:alpha/beta hydrolase n=1 Tax=Gemmatimonas sp. TaxID=1962908 RepID=UPI0037BED01F
MLIAGLDPSLHPTPPVPATAGSLLHFPEIRSRFLEQPHDVIVFLPPGYHEQPDRRYPVLYLHDGQNVFDDLPLSPFGVQWGVDTTARALVHARVIEPLIIIAVGNAGRDRIDEFTPTRDNMHDAGGLADRYGQMLVYEIKPWVDHSWRTRRTARDTAVAGSSLGGLLSLHLGLTHPAIFGKVGLLSPSVWWDDRWIVRQLAAGGRRPDLHIWLDVGTGEARMLKGTRLLYRMLLRKGWRIGTDLHYMEAEGALHDERAWGERAGLFLRFLFPAHP